MTAVDRTLAGVMADELELTDVQAVNSERYWAAIRAGALRRTGLNDPNREFNLARLRAEMVAGNEGGVTRWPGGGSDV